MSNKEIKFTVPPENLTELEEKVAEEVEKENRNYQIIGLEYREGTDNFTTNSRNDLPNEFYE